MKNFKCLALLLVLQAVYTYGQTKRLTSSVYFKSDRFDLRKEQKEVLDTLARFLEGKDIRKIIVKGYTDSDADSSYNLKLSENRILSVQQYLTSISIDPKVFKAAYFGETSPVAPNNSDEGKQKNRRVDIIVTYDEIQVITEIPKKEVVIPYVDTCARDTTIYLSQGTSYTINICDYYKNRNCISITEFSTPEAVLNSGFTTVTTSNEQLVTGGMFTIKLCDDKPLVRPLKLRVPVRFFLGGCGGRVDYSRMSLWTGNRNGQWGGSRKIDIVGSGDSMFYEFVVTRAGNYNLDYKMSERNLKDIKTGFKARGKVRLVEVILLYPAPELSLRKAKPFKRNKVKMKLPKCPSNGCDSIFVKAIGINENGDTVVTSKALNSYKKRKLFGKCKLRRNEGFILGIIPIAVKAIYRKYIIMPEDWKLKHEN